MISIPVIQGDVNGFNTFLYGEKNIETVGYLERLNQEILTKVQSIGSPVADFFAKAREEFDLFNGEEALRKARSVLRKIDSVMIPNRIMSLSLIGEIQNAPIIMQRFMMADPFLYQLAQDQKINGWSETFVDCQPGVTGIWRDDYCKVYNGVVTEVPDKDGNIQLIASNYANVDKPGDIVVDIPQQHDLIHSMLVANYYIKLGEEDPSDPSNGKL